MDVGDRLRELRGTRTLQEFADPLGVGGSNISNIENGRSKLSVDLAIRIAEVYNISIDWLLRGIGSIRPETQSTVQESQTDYVTISKDELIELQRIALGKTIEEKKKADQQIERLKNN